MILATAFCKRDSGQFLRLLGWLKRLCAYEAGSLRHVAATLITADVRRVVVKQAVAEMENLFASVSLILLEDAPSGWPHGPNAMIRAALLSCAEKDDMLWLEPDAIPLNPGWWNVIQEEWRSRKPHQHFMGALVEQHWNHLSGVAVYGAQWRTYAPKLSCATDMAWDVFTSDQVLPRARFTNVIQHIFNNPVIQSLDQLDPKSVIFHQAKGPALIELLEKKWPVPKPPRRKAADVLGWERIGR